MENTIIVEICCGNVPAMRAAKAAGADRVELCADLSVGGVTPSHDDIVEAVEIAGDEMAVNVLVRARGGDFVYSPEEVALMEDDIRFCAGAGVDGVVVGALTADGDVDMKISSRLVELAHGLGLSVTFHRAVDEAADTLEALDDVLELGVERVLTSGGAATAFEGREVIGEMVRVAERHFMDALMEGEEVTQKTIIMPGCGVSGDNVAELLEATGAAEVHGTRLSILEALRHGS